uniref:Uncharacterized protein n=1 Tax=Siphoviridae sp. ctk4d14 TaxID=2825639 RepID=A0A8S5QJX9_9CAUD|nr:MAG TPA: hypothetical protein [Siphoviridae sp. ctk4d14]DAM26538.1 MAG TPA: hypothetical protein [Caudoviricetes sp.]DAY86510.1 MAG TPA: hypothetical protein [Caudoviricetes sp.]
MLLSVIYTICEHMSTRFVNLFIDFFHVSCIL